MLPPFFVWRHPNFKALNFLHPMPSNAILIPAVSKESKR